MQEQTNFPPTKLSKIPQHSHFNFSEANEPLIFFNSQFESGNMKEVVRNNFDHYSIWTASDAEGTQHMGFPKSWFYFQAGGFKDRKITFSIHRVHFLWAMISRNHLYRPVFRTQDKDGNWQQWKRLPNSVHSISLNSSEELILKFDFYFPINSIAQFAFLYPYTHEDCHKQMTTLQNKLSSNNSIFYQQYQLCRSYQGRVLDMVIISSHEGKEGFETIKTDSTFTLGGKKLQKFRNNKPIIFISSRVHPIETPSSFTMQGIINYLLNENDYRAHLLRKHFVFYIVPMLNPDGVSNGHCRMDALNQNLNRYYKNPDPIKQPSCYSIAKLGEYFSEEKRLFMYLDLHAHPANKGNFIFGNAIFDYVEQVESHLFPKILSQNCINFEWEQCNFSRKHMKAKDRKEDMNKQGCGRVVFYKEFGLTHSYTLECGYHTNTYNNNLQPQTNHSQLNIARYRLNEKNEKIYDNFEQIINPTPDFDLQSFLADLMVKKGGNGNYGFQIFKNEHDALDDQQNAYYKQDIVYYEPQTFRNLGRNICISILDVWSKNPYTRIKNINQQRIQIAQKQAQLDRFRKEQVGIKSKQKKVVELIHNQCYAQWHKRNVFLDQPKIGVFKKFAKTSINAKRISNSVENNDNLKANIQVTYISAPRISLSKNLIHENKSLKDKKKIGAIQPSLQSIKCISGSEIYKGSVPLRAMIQEKTFLKPFSLKVKSIMFTTTK